MGKGSRPHRSKARCKRPTGIGHSRAGRPRKAGERYPSGGLKPIAPNERVTALRRALLGETAATGARLKAAENPLDLMHARGWLTTEQQETGRTFARLHARGRMNQAPIKTTNLEARGRGRSARSDPVALWRLGEIWNALAVDERNALIEVCVLEAWPAWLARAAITEEEALRSTLLASPGCRALARGLSKTALVVRAPLPAGLAAGSDLADFVNADRGG